MSGLVLPLQRKVVGDFNLSSKGHWHPSLQERGARNGANLSCSAVVEEG
jgi:hypothetical protein